MPAAAVARRQSSEARTASEASSPDGSVVPTAATAEADVAVAKLENVAKMVGAAIQRLRLPPAMRLLDELMSMQARRIEHLEEELSPRQTPPNPPICVRSTLRAATFPLSFPQIRSASDDQLARTLLGAFRSGLAADQFVLALRALVEAADTEERRIMGEVAKAVEEGRGDAEAVLSAAEGR